MSNYLRRCVLIAAAGVVALLTAHVNAASITSTYLSLDRCEHPERGCPLAELARADKRMKPQIVAELVNYKSRIVPFMPGQQTADKNALSLRFCPR
jgi:hypothetical protein